MAENSLIGWTHHTVNFWWGCNKVSTECENCYIEGTMRWAGRVPFAGPMRTKDWSAPSRWNRSAQQRGVRQRVFTCSMSDFFHRGADSWRAEAWKVIRDCSQLDWLVLTKRADRILDHLPRDWGEGYPNVWMGVTCGARSSLWRLAKLQQVPAQVRFVSAEPLLESMDFRPYLSWLNWIITGCERAAKGKRRPMNAEWVEDVDRQCKEAGVAHFFKQAYVGERGVPCEQPLLAGSVVQELPTVP